MLKLIRLNDDAFILRTSTNAISGDRQRVIRAMLMLDVEPNEIEAGLSDLMTNGTHLAEYGVNLTFLFSKNLA
jgi:hypothetical protein